MSKDFLIELLCPSDLLLLLLFSLLIVAASNWLSTYDCNFLGAQ